MVANGLILLYHRVAELTNDPQLLAVTPAHFNEHLDVLRELSTPMPLRQLIADSGERQLSSPAIAVTFDDGYADNFECAEPLLARHDVPATVFITTSYVGGEREFWWDEIERLLLDPEECPGWNVECRADPSPGHREYRDVCLALRGVSGAERSARLDAIGRASGNASTGRSTHRAVSRERLASACASGLIDIGAHTVTHSCLSALSEAQQRTEIEGSKTALTDITGREPAGFSYPFGGRADYNRKTVALVRDAGFAFACANRPGLVERASDPYQLPRLLVRDWDGDVLAAKLRELGW